MDFSEFGQASTGSQPAEVVDPRVQLAQQVKEEAQKVVGLVNFRLAANDLVSTAYRMPSPDQLESLQSPELTDVQQKLVRVFDKLMELQGFQLSDDLETCNAQIRQRCLDHFQGLSDKWKSEKKAGVASMKTMSMSLHKQMANVLYEKKSDKHVLAPASRIQHVFGAGEPPKIESFYSKTHVDDSEIYFAMLKEGMKLEKGLKVDVDTMIRTRRQEVQKRTQKTVDRKASKGRRLKYVSIDPLVNFMPADEDLDRDPIETEQFMVSLFAAP